MHEPHFYIDDAGESGGELTLVGENLHHLRHVLCLRPGENVVLFDRDGRRALCEIKEVLKTHASLQVKDRFCVDPPPLALQIGMAFLQPHKVDLTIQKCAEWAAASLTPLITRRSRAFAGDKRPRWQKIAVDAACQSESPIVLEVKEPMPLAQFIGTSPEGRRLILDEEEGGAPLRTILESSPPTTATILIGPEGGWERSEVEQAQKTGFERASLGRRNFRSETAVISAVTLIMHYWGMAWKK